MDENDEEMSEEELSKRVDQFLVDAKALGVVPRMVDYAIDLQEPLLGREAREDIDKIVGKKGKFETVRTVSIHEVRDTLDPDENNLWLEAVADQILEGMLDYVFEATPAWKGETYPTIVFTFEGE